VLQRVLGAGVGEHLAADTEQGTAVALDDRLERALVARAGEGDEPGVRLGPE
jgi:hypothetical protein